jgi:N-formylglutamate amidohydrolase
MQVIYGIIINSLFIEGYTTEGYNSTEHACHIYNINLIQVFLCWIHVINNFLNLKSALSPVKIT